MNTLVLLAAGAGTRLRPLNDQVPKCLIAVDGRPLLDGLLDHFSDWADQTVIVTGHLHEQLQEYVAKRRAAGPVVTRHNPLYASTNSLFSAAIARDAWVTSDAVILSNTDVIFDTDTLKSLIASDEQIVLSVDVKTTDTEDMKVLLSRGTQRIARVSKDLPPEQCLGEFTGVTKLEGSGIRRLAEAIESLLRQPGMAERAWYDLALDFVARRHLNLAFEAVSNGGYWELDTLEDLQSVRSQQCVQATTATHESQSKSQ